VQGDKDFLKRWALNISASFTPQAAPEAGSFAPKECAPIPPFVIVLQQSDGTLSTFFTADSGGFFADRPNHCF
jgi:hypothetical protein